MPAYKFNYLKSVTLIIMIPIILLSGADVIAVTVVVGPLCSALLTAAMVNVYLDKGCSVVAVYIRLLSLVPDTLTHVNLLLPSSECCRT